MQADATHWSTRTMVSASGVSQTAVRLIWRAFGLQPHRQETFKLSTDPQFVAKTRDIVGLYLAPPTKALVLCVDEKSQIQALDRTQPILPWLRACRSAAPTTTRATAPPHCLRRSMWRPARSWGNCIGGIVVASFCSSCALEANVPAQLDVHLIMDNYGTHKTPKVRPSFTPSAFASTSSTSASWLNQVERWFATLTVKRIRRGTHRSRYQLEACIRQYLDTYNTDPKPFSWTKSADDIMASIERFCLNHSVLSGRCAIARPSRATHRSGGPCRATCPAASVGWSCERQHLARSRRC